MQLMKSAWNLQETKAQKNTIKSRAIRWFIWFMLLMVACTIISRAASSITTALVDVETPQQGRITQTVHLSGSLQTAGDLPILVEGGRMVSQVYVEKGDWVKQGDPLFAYSLDHIAKQIKETEDAILRKELGIKDSKSQNAQSSKQKNRSIQRAYEDMNSAAAAGDRRIKQAQEDLDAAKASYSDYVNHTSAEEFSNSVSASLQAAVTGAERSLEQAKLDRETALLPYLRAIEDAEDSVADSAAKLAQMDLDQLKETLQTLQDELQANGQVLAPIDGIVTDSFVAPGKTTGSEASMYLNDAKEMQYVAEIDEAQKKRLSPGDSIQLRFSSDEQPTKLSIKSIEPIEGKGECYKLVADIPKGQGLPGQSLNAESAKRSEMYYTTIPLSALRQDDNDHFVLVLKEVNGILGTELEVERVDVQIIEKNESRAAVNGALNGGSRLVTSSSRQLRSGDRVRLAS